MTSAALLYDAGPDAGLGHERRMRALGAAFAGRGVTTHIQPVADAVGRFDLLVLDSYRWRAERWRAQTRVLVAIDDLGRDLEVDLLVDPSPGASASNHRRAERVLAGPLFALLPEGLADVPGPALSDRPIVLVACGAADSEGRAQTVASRLIELAPAAEVRLVIGPWSDQHVPPGAHPVLAATGLETELGQATIVVTSGGVTLLEALALGRPTVVFAVADNQAGAVRGAVDAGAALLAGTIEDAPFIAAKLLTDPRLQQALSERARRLIDGRGSGRVADEALRILQDLR